MDKFGFSPLGKMREKSSELICSSVDDRYFKDKPDDNFKGANFQDSALSRRYFHTENNNNGNVNSESGIPLEEKKEQSFFSIERCSAVMAGLMGTRSVPLISTKRLPTIVSSSNNPSSKSDGVSKEDVFMTVSDATNLKETESSLDINEKKKKINACLANKHMKSGPAGFDTDSISTFKSDMDCDLCNQPLVQKGSSSSIKTLQEKSNEKTSPQSDTENLSKENLIVGSPSEIVELQNPAFDVNNVRDQLTAVYERFAKTEIPSNNFEERLKSMLYSLKNVNLNIWIDRKRFQVNMTVLQCYSVVFSLLDMSLPAHVELPHVNITPRAFKIIYIWMLTPNAKIHRKHIIEVLRGAVYLQVSNMVDQIWTMIDSTLTFNEKSAFVLFKEATYVDVDQIQLLMVTRICKYYLTLITTTDFLSLTIKDVVRLLSQNTIGVNSEVEVLFSVIIWVDHDWDERSQHLIELLKCVRFRLVQPYVLVELLRDLRINIPRVANTPGIRDAIQNAIMYGNVKHSGRNKCLTAEEISFFAEPPSRVWIVDPACEYHHTKNCTNHYCIDYELFKGYLYLIQSGNAPWKSRLVQSTMDRCLCSEKIMTSTQYDKLN